jgi:ABC-2 type transport system ATP-binding protein
VADPLIIETADLRKHYGPVAALQGLTLEVPRGSLFGFLGRNGAGKTTTIKVLLGMAHPSAGQARVFGLPAGADGGSVEIRRRTGFVSDEKDLYDYMTVHQMIRFTAPLFPRWRADLEQRYAARFELPLDRKVKALSRGTRTKLALLLALCRGAELLVLDEPTSGLDPAMTEEVLQILVTHVASEETTVFFSSHQIAEVEQIADRVAIIDRGPVERGGRRCPGRGPRAHAGVGGRRPCHVEGHLSRDRHDGGSRCSGIRPGSRHAGASSSVLRCWRSRPAAPS